MKIGVIAHLKHGIRQPFAGGLEMHTHMLVRGLQARGHEVTLFAARNTDPLLQGVEICDELIDDADFFRSEHRIYRQLMDRLRVADFDLVHNNSLHYLTVTLAPLLPMPMVTTLHTPPFWEIEGGMRLCGAGSSAYVAVSDYIGSAWSEIVTVDQTIRNGIDLDRFAYRPDPDTQPYLAWCGRIVPEKGLHLAIAAARRAGLVLQIAGPIADAAYFRNQIAPQLGADIVHRGHLDHDAMTRLVSGARALLCTPMWDEPYGLVIAEALACGTPVASFARGAVGELIDASCGATVPADDVAALAEAAIAVAGLPRLACRQRAEAVAGMAAMIAGYEQLYRRLIDRRAGRSPPIDAGATLPRTLESAGLLALYRSRLPRLFSPVPETAEAAAA